MYNFTLTLTRPDGPGCVGIDPVANYGYWEFLDGSEGGGLWFETTPNGVELVDFDGHTHLPAPIVALLRKAGYYVDETFN